MDELIKKINVLPAELVSLIKEYIHRKNFVFVDRTNYSLYHYLIKSSIPKFENYLRDMIRRDNDFVFEHIVRENYKKWFTIKSYIYKNMVFKNYVYFINHYCIENESAKCRFFIKNFLQELGLCKNQHKKNVVNYIRWKK